MAVTYNYPFKIRSVDVSVGDSEPVKILYLCNFNWFNPEKPVSYFYGKINERFDISPNFMQVVFFPYIKGKYDRSFYKTFLWKVIESFYPGHSIDNHIFPIYDVETLKDLNKIVYHGYKL